MPITRNILTSFLAVISLIAGFAIAPLAAEESATAQPGEKVLFTGEWTKKTSKSSGTWSIYSEGATTYIKLSSDFRTRKAPDLKIFLSPLETAETNGKNATQGSLLIAELSSNAGEQLYEIPAGVDLTSYRSVLIHCEQYSKLWSAANLN